MKVVKEVDGGMSSMAPEKGRAEFAQESAKTEQGKGKSGFAHPTNGYEAEVH